LISRRRGPTSISKQRLSDEFLGDRKVLATGYGRQHETSRERSASIVWIASQAVEPEAGRCAVGLSRTQLFFSVCPGVAKLQRQAKILVRCQKYDSKKPSGFRNI
jgi:hypothetical protein